MNKLTFILGICCVVFLALWLRSCQSKPAAPLASDKKVDSLNAVLKVHDSAHTHAMDSVVKVADKAIKRVDSLEKGLSLLHGELKGKDRDISGLIDRVNQAEIAKDTAGALAACDSLKIAYPAAKGLVTEYITKNDSLIAVNHQIITAKDTIIGHLNSMFTETNNTLFQISREYGNVTVELKKEIKNAAKRFGTGPAVVITVVNGKISVLPGWSVHYSLIRF